MGELRTLGVEGDTKLIWDSNDDDEVVNARRTFDDLVRRGFNAYSVESGGKRGNRIREFDPDAESIILVPQLRGGA